MPEPPSRGSLVLLDLAFAADESYERVTRPLIRALGPRLLAWIDHHRHPAWIEYEQDPRFVLVSRKQAPGCPQLISSELVQSLGPVDQLWAHADFDGCLSAAKFLNGGEPCYAEMDEDARALDSPGWGFVSTARGLRLARAIEALEDAEHGLDELLQDIVAALLAGRESAKLESRIDKLVEQRIEHEADLMPLLDQAERPHPDLLFLEVDWDLGSANRKLLLRAMEYEAVVAMIREPGNTSVATFHAEQGPGLVLNRLPGLRGLEGYAFGAPRPGKLLPAIIELIERYKARDLF